MGTHDEQMITLLERIAVALEAIANSPRREDTAAISGRTEIPWNKVSVRCRKYLRSAVESNKFNEFDGYSWPLCCEDLLALGFERLVSQIYIRNWGRKCAEEIVPLMDSLGFTGWQET